jgi:hypothetical protein
MTPCAALAQFFQALDSAPAEPKGTKAVVTMTVAVTIRRDQAGAQDMLVLHIQDGRDCV